MKNRHVSPGVIFFVVAVVTCVIVYFVVNAPCKRVEWIERSGLSIAGNSQLVVYEAWCLPVKPLETRRLLTDRIRFLRREKVCQLRVSQGEMIAGLGYWGCGDNVYGFMYMKNGADEDRSLYQFVYRVLEGSQLQICAEVSGLSLDDETSIQRIDCGKENSVEGADCIVRVREPDGKIREGHIEVPFDQCVDASELVSLSWRTRRFFQKFGIGAPSVQKFVEAVPHLSRQDIVYENFDQSD